MMPILVKGDDVRRRTKAEAHHGRLLAAREWVTLSLALRGCIWWTFSIVVDFNNAH